MAKSGSKSMDGGGEYNQELNGIYGKFMAGAGCQIFFLQTAITPDDLEKITLVGNIEGSETWPVRDLFQRDVDELRVRSSIVPYFNDTTRAKFFNPLTLTFLPYDTVEEKVINDIEVLPEKKIKFGSGDTTADWKCIEYQDPGFYRFRWRPEVNNIGAVDWNSENVKIVAVDGQHRLSALKRFYGEWKGKLDDFSECSIPVVLFSVVGQKKGGDRADLQGVVRSIFVVINSHARQVSEGRQILLSDDSINRICAQELLEHSHRNDVEPEIEKRDPSIVPLLFYDWRGGIEANKHSPACILRIEEIHNWFKHFLFQDKGRYPAEDDTDFSDIQLNCLGIKNSDELHNVEEGAGLRASQEEQVRKAFRKTMLPGIAYLLQNFTPYKNYINALREIEVRKNSESPLAKLAFFKMRFGASRARDNQNLEVDREFLRIIREVTALKQELPEIMSAKLLGSRGVMFAFGWLREFYQESFGKFSWLSYSQWFTQGLNGAVDGEWFDLFPLESAPRKVKACTRNVVWEWSKGKVDNEEHKKAHRGFGSIVALLVLRYCRSGRERLKKPLEIAASDLCREELRKHLMIRHRSEEKHRINNDPDQEPLTRDEERALAEKRAKRKTKTLLNKIWKELDQIAPAID